MCYLFDWSFTSSLVNSALACNQFDITFLKLFSLCGTPLGSDIMPLFLDLHSLISYLGVQKVYPALKKMPYWERCRHCLRRSKKSV
ncbi:hypothetical protein KSP40_PGU001368 [Platanthera guangdongensis]|uniref:Uncharacterized protein n=1 Tax=Platanthera guangdongensis TaxID=2320717 RepID=A0ABR2MMN4_9ASPA